MIESKPEATDFFDVIELQRADILRSLISDVPILYDMSGADIVETRSVGNRPARGQGRLVPGDAAPIVALKFGQGRQSLPRPIGGQGRLGIMYLCIYDL